MEKSACLLGPVSRQIFPSFKIHSFEINAFPSFLRACSTTGWRPPEISKFCDKSTAGLTQDSFLAKNESWVKPAVDLSQNFEISGGRHPVVEHALKKEGKAFISNECILNDGKICLLTGPSKQADFSIV